MTRREIRALDRFVSERVRARGACQRCSSTKHLQTSHFYSRKYLTVRFLPDNVFCLCARCHFHMTFNPLDHVRFVTTQLGSKRLFVLEQLRYIPYTPTTVATVKGWWT